MLTVISSSSVVFSRYLDAIGQPNYAIDPLGAVIASFTTIEPNDASTIDVMYLGAAGALGVSRGFAACMLEGFLGEDADADILTGELADAYALGVSLRW